MSSGLNVFGIVSSVAGIVTVIPGLELAEVVFGLGLIARFVWLRRPAGSPSRTRIRDCDPDQAAA